MPFITGDRHTPFQVRMARVLLIVEAGFGLLAAMLVLILELTGASGSTSVSLNNAGIALFASFAAVLVYGALAWRVGELDPIARWLALGLQLPPAVVLISSFVDSVRSGSPGVANVAFGMAVVIGVVVCLTINSVDRYFKGAPLPEAQPEWVPPALDQPVRKAEPSEHAEVAVKPVTIQKVETRPVAAEPAQPGAAE